MSSDIRDKSMVFAAELSCFPTFQSIQNIFTDVIFLRTVFRLFLKSSTYAENILTHVLEPIRLTQ